MLTTMIVSGLISGVIAAVLYKTINSTKTPRQLEPNNIDPLVKEIINLMEADPAGWQFRHRQGKYMAYYWHEQAGVSLPVGDNGRVDSIWKPAIVDLTRHEKSMLDIAVRQMLANRVGERVTQKLLGP